MMLVSLVRSSAESLPLGEEPFDEAIICDIGEGEGLTSLSPHRSTTPQSWPYSVKASSSST